MRVESFPRPRVKGVLTIFKLSGFPTRSLPKQKNIISKENMVEGRDASSNGKTFDKKENMVERTSMHEIKKIKRDKITLSQAPFSTERMERGVVDH